MFNFPLVFLSCLAFLGYAQGEFINVSSDGQKCFVCVDKQYVTSFFEVSKLFCCLRNYSLRHKPECLTHGQRVQFLPLQEENLLCSVANTYGKAYELANDFEVARFHGNTKKLFLKVYFLQRNRNFKNYSHPGRTPVLWYLQWSFESRSSRNVFLAFEVEVLDGWIKHELFYFPLFVLSCNS